VALSVSKHKGTSVTPEGTARTSKTGLCLLGLTNLESLQSVGLRRLPERPAAAGPTLSISLSLRERESERVSGRASERLSLLRSISLSGALSRSHPLTRTCGSLDSAATKFSIQIPIVKYFVHFVYGPIVHHFLLPRSNK
jgi:hypothetical protein